ncbi:MAG: DUF4426 domain-containing protein [Gammaproteobacteria bacterium]|nr:DUF4426 domain-containing protein [Gammaproteobacteria bacterium]
MIRNAMHPARWLPLFGTLAFLTACEQPTGSTAEAQEQDPTVLPGTESSRDFGDYVVHFNAIRTDQLTQEIARQYGIVRSKNRAMLNVSILKKAEGTMGIPVTGSVSASAITLSGQLRSITLREIKEGTAVYYVGETGISDGETLIFTVDVTPINEASRFTVRFRKQFFVED